MPQATVLFQEISESLLFTLFQIGLTVSIIGLVLLLLRRVLQKRYPARIMCFIWALLAVRLILPIQLTLPKPLVTVTPRLNYVQWNDDSSETTSLSPTDLQQSHAQWLSESEMHTIAEQDDSPSVIHFSTLLLLAWFVGTALFLWRELHSYYAFKRQLYATLSQPSSPVLQRIFGEECTAAGINHRPMLAISPIAHCPQLLSARNPLLVLPHEQFTDEDIRFILRHELTHLHHRDLWLKYLLVLARALHWFNPLIHLLAHAANEDIELSCDSAVAASLNTCERKKYGYTILNSALEQRMQTSMVSCFTGDKEILMKRFENLFDRRVKKHGLTLILVVALLTVGCGSAFAISSTSQPLPTEKERIALAEAWGTQRNNNAIHTIRLDGEHTFLISEIQPEGTDVPYRTAEELHFAQKNGIWQIVDSAVVAAGDVRTLETFRLLYENDLGLPIESATPSKGELPLPDANAPENVATHMLHLKGGRIEIINQTDVSYDGNPDLIDMRYTFADGSVVNLQTAGGIVQDWSDARAKNNRTPADLTQQFARSISHKTVWYLYPVLSEQGQHKLARYQQDLVDSAPDGIWYSKLGGSSPSYRGYQILPDTNDQQSCLVVFQMYGGGWNDSRCAYRVTTKIEQGCSVIANITPVTAETHTNKDLFDLYYRSGLPLPTIQKDIAYYNGTPMASLTTPDGAARAIFQTDTPRHSFTGTSVTIQKQDNSNATVLLTFADGSGSAVVNMHRDEKYWMPTADIPTTPNNNP